MGNSDDYSLLRDKYWAMYSEIKTTEFYYWHYLSSAVLKDKIINGALCLTSLASISSWLIWSHLPWLWAIILGATQVIGAIKHLFPFSKQISAANLFLPELRILLHKIDCDWDSVDEMTKGEIKNLIYQHRLNFIELENKYIGDTYFPRKKRCQNSAIKDRKTFFFHSYGISESISFTEVKS